MEAAKEEIKEEIAKEPAKEFKRPQYTITFGDIEGVSYLYKALTGMTFDAEQYNEAMVVSQTKKSLEKLLKEYSTARAAKQPE